MKKWKIAWLAVMVIVLSWGIVWVLKDKRTLIESQITVLPTPTILDKIVRIAVMADIHSDGVELKKMLVRAKDDGVELVVVAGDLTIKGEKTELIKIKKVLDESNLNYVAVPGNHEYDVEDYMGVFGKNYQSIRLDEGIELILIDNSFWKGLGEEQKIWLDNEVKECRVLLCIAIMHKPLNNILSTHVMGENNKKVTEEATWLRELLINSGVRQIEAGHLHYASSYELEGIRTDIVGAISRDRNNQSPRYTELMIGKNIIERNVVEETNDIGN